MGKKWMPITAGILDIVYGVGGIVLGFAFIIITRWLGPYDMINEITGWLLIVFGVLAIVGGVYAFRTKRWPLTFVGAILSLAPSIPYMYMYWRWDFSPDSFFDISSLLGFSGIPAVIAIILTVLSRKRFERK